MGLQMLLYDSNTKLCVGEEASFSESGDYYNVRVRGIWEQKYGLALGMAYDLELLGVDTTDRIMFSVGERKTVWKANYSGGYGCFSLNKLSSSGQM